MKPAELVLHASWKLAYLLMCIATMGCLIILLMPLNGWLKLSLILYIAVIATYIILRDVLLKLPYSYVSLELNKHKQIVLLQKDGQRFVCDVMPESVVFKPLTVLQVKPAGAFFSRNIVIVANSVDSAEFRRWRVWLRWYLPHQRA